MVRQHRPLFARHRTGSGYCRDCNVCVRERERQLKQKQCATGSCACVCVCACRGVCVCVRERGKRQLTWCQLGAHIIPFPRGNADWNIKSFHSLQTDPAVPPPPTPALHRLRLRAHAACWFWDIFCQTVDQSSLHLRAFNAAGRPRLAHEEVNEHRWTDEQHVSFNMTWWIAVRLLCVFRRTAGMQRRVFVKYYSSSSSFSRAIYSRM